MARGRGHFTPILCKPLIGLRGRLKSFGKKIQRAIVAASPPLVYHANSVAAQTVLKNAQLLLDQFGTKATASVLLYFNWLNAQTALASTSGTPARMFVNERIQWEMYNTGASILYVNINEWVCREDVLSIAGQTDTVANMIAHGQALVPQNAAVASSAAFATTEPGYNLFLNPYWCRHWKSVRTWKLRLLPGERFRHIFKQKFVWDQKETELSGAQTVSFIKGCRRIVGYAYGQPSFDANAGAAPTNIGSAAGGLIGYVFSDAKLGYQTIGNQMVAQNPTVFNLATAGHVWQPVASNEATVTLF